MKKLQKLLAAFMVVILCVTSLNPTVAEAKATKTKVYCFYASTVDKFRLSNGKLTIQIVDDYDIELVGDYSKIKNKDNTSVFGKSIKSKKLTYKVAKKCKWRTVSVCDKFSEDGDITSYKEMKENIMSTQTEEWDFGILVFVKGKKIVKVAARLS